MREVLVSFEYILWMGFGYETFNGEYIPSFLFRFKLYEVDEGEISFGVIVCNNLIMIIFYLDYYYVQGQINISLQI